MLRPFTCILTFFATLLALPALAQPEGMPEFGEGQVWAYDTREGDEGSLLKIQLVEEVGPAEARATIYHLSLIGVNAPGSTEPLVVMHIPISAEALEASVTEPYYGPALFPDAENGIAMWRRDQGGVFGIPLKEIAEILAQNFQSMQVDAAA